MEKLIIERLREQKEYVSGQALSEILGVSRTAVWKHINDLRKEGYQIVSSSKKGYKLVSSPDVLNQREIRVLDGQLVGGKIIYFDKIDSTNNYAKRTANDGCPDGTVIIAERQTQGRGRIGREWDSDNAEGVWFSVILKPNIDPEKIQIITLAASVAVVEAIRNELGIICGIKWPNDIILNGCKVGGILTELSAEPGHINYLVIGIGINANQEICNFNKEIQQKAISLKMYSGKKINRSGLLTRMLESIDNVYKEIQTGNSEKIIDRWKNYSVTIGKSVKFMVSEIEYVGIALSVAENGKLVIQCNDGQIREVSAGEIQVRGLLGYA